MGKPSSLTVSTSTLSNSSKAVLCGSCKPLHSSDCGSCNALYSNVSINIEPIHCDNSTCKSVDRNNFGSSWTRRVAGFLSPLWARVVGEHKTPDRVGKGKTLVRSRVGGGSNIVISDPIPQTNGGRSKENVNSEAIPQSNGSVVKTKVGQSKPLGGDRQNGPHKTPYENVNATQPVTEGRFSIVVTPNESNVDARPVENAQTLSKALEKSKRELKETVLIDVKDINALKIHGTNTGELGSNKTSNSDLTMKTPTNNDDLKSSAAHKRLAFAKGLLTRTFRKAKSKTNSNGRLNDQNIPTKCNAGYIGNESDYSDSFESDEGSDSFESDDESVGNRNGENKASEQNTNTNHSKTRKIDSKSNKIIRNKSEQTENERNNSARNIQVTETKPNEGIRLKKHGETKSSPVKPDMSKRWGCESTQISNDREDRSHTKLSITAIPTIPVDNNLVEIKRKAPTVPLNSVESPKNSSPSVGRAGPKNLSPSVVIAGPKNLSPSVVTKDKLNLRKNDDSRGELAKMDRTLSAPSIVKTDLVSSTNTKVNEYLKSGVWQGSS